jgi:tetratricopeptide (TPR) repeat protein
MVALVFLLIAQFSRKDAKTQRNLFLTIRPALRDPWLKFFGDCHFPICNPVRQVSLPVLENGQLQNPCLACFQKALEINPAFVEAHYNFSFALCSKGQLDEAIRELQETLRLKPDYAEASNNLVHILGLKEKQARQPTNSSNP